MTDATKPAATKTTTASTKTTRTEPQIAVGALPDGFVIPEPVRGGGASKYPIDSLEVGGAFGVKNKTKRDLAALIARANAKYSQRAKDVATGKVKVLSTEREFFAVDVDAVMAESLKGTSFEGSTVLVTRRK